MRLLDLFCGAGGAAIGYHRAGFDHIVGVDIDPQPKYPFGFVQADALNAPVNLDDFDLIHASPPCQVFTNFARAGLVDGDDHSDLLTPTLDLLERVATPWIVENVPSSGLDGITLCGSMFGLNQLRRHRRFASNQLILQPSCQHHLQSKIIGVYGNGGPQNPGGRGRRYRNNAEALRVMGLPAEIGWPRRSITEAIPPVYTQFLGEQFLAHR